MTNAQILANLSIPPPFNYAGIDIKIEQLDYIPNSDILVVDTLLNSKIRETFLYKNPPIRIPDGGTKLVEDCNCEREVPSFKEDPLEALKIILGDSAKIFLSHREL